VQTGSGANRRRPSFLSLHTAPRGGASPRARAAGMEPGDDTKSAARSKWKAGRAASARGRGRRGGARGVGRGRTADDEEEMATNEARCARLEEKREGEVAGGVDLASSTLLPAALPFSYASDSSASDAGPRRGADLGELLAALGPADAAAPARARAALDAALPPPPADAATAAAADAVFAIDVSGLDGALAGVSLSALVDAPRGALSSDDGESAHPSASGLDDGATESDASDGEPEAAPPAPPRPPPPLPTPSALDAELDALLAGTAGPGGGPGGGWL